MAMRLIPPPVGIHYRRQRTALSGVDYQLFWAYNDRTESWTLSLAIVGDTAEPTPVLNGAKLHIGYDLLKRCRHAQRPAGQIWVYRVDGTRVHPGVADLGTSCHVLYLEPGESLPEGVRV